MAPLLTPHLTNYTQTSQHQSFATAYSFAIMFLLAVLMLVTTPAMLMWSGKEMYLEPVCLSEDLTLHIASTESTVVPSSIRAHTLYPSVLPSLTLTETEACQDRRVTWVEVTVNPEPIHVTHTSSLVFSTFVMHLSSPGTTTTHTAVNTVVLSIALTRRNLEDVIVTVTDANTVTRTTTVEVRGRPSTVTVTSTRIRTMRRVHTTNERSSRQPRRPSVRILYGGGIPRRPNGLLPHSPRAPRIRSTCSTRSTSHM